jgi:hypothetical protein
MNRNRLGFHGFPKASHAFGTQHAKRTHRFAPLLCVAALVGALVMVSPAAADTSSTSPSSNGFYINYSPTSEYEVDDVALFEQGAPDPDPNGYGITSSFTAPAGTSIITDPFLKFDPIEQTFLLGVATNLSSDGGDGQQHLVVFSNDAFALSAQSIDFGTLFPNTNEAAVISSLEDLGSANPDYNADGNVLFNFAAGDAVNGPNGSIAFAPGDTFTEVAFSDGQIIGTGESFTTPGPATISATPEPSTWALMIAGLGGIGLMLRRAKTAMGLRANGALTV